MIRFLYVSLVTVEYLKIHLGLTGTVRHDAQLAQWGAGVSTLVQRWCGREFAQASLTEFYHTNGTKNIVLRRRPVTSVDSVHLDYTGYAGQSQDPFPVSSLLREGIDYYLDERSPGLSNTGLLVRSKGVWPERVRAREPDKLVAESYPLRGNLKVSYTGGYAEIPQDIQFACAQIVSFARRSAPFGAAPVMERLGDHLYKIGQIALMTAPELGSARQILTIYKEMPW